jgi:transcriptional regulator with PAS, ATPase and Fis domain
MMTKQIITILCKKYNLAYAFFDENFKVLAYSNLPFQEINADIREYFYELIGLEEEIKKLKTLQEPLVLNMINKDDGYYDINVEYIQNKGYLIYMQRKDQDIQTYTKSIQETNEQLLLESLTKSKVKVNDESIVVLVQNKKIISINKNFCDFFQIQIEKPIGQNLSDFFKKKRSLFIKANTFTAIDTQKKKHLFNAKEFELFDTQEKKQVYIFTQMPRK